MEDATVKSLSTISAPRSFKKGTYICHEGELGRELFIVVKGSVGVYINDMLDTETEAAHIFQGELFGEMALVDNMPRSASCIAQEDTICIAVERANLRKLIINCPEIAETLLLSMSMRLRDMDDRLFKSRFMTSTENTSSFDIPYNHRGHSNKEPFRGGGKYFDVVPTTCPVCGKRITVYHLRQFDMKLKEVLPNQRRIYQDLDVLWHYIWTCSECNYSNFHAEFFRLNPASRGDYLRTITAETSALKSRAPDNTSPFDALVFTYYRAIHFNECFNAGNLLLLGKLWLYLNWLYEDVNDHGMAHECREKAKSYYESAYDNRERLLPTPGARQQCAMILAEIFLDKGDTEKAHQYYLEVVNYPGKRLTQNGYDRLYSLRKRSQEDLEK